MATPPSEVSNICTDLGNPLCIHEEWFPAPINKVVGKEEFKLPFRGVWIDVLIRGSVGLVRGMTKDSTSKVFFEDQNEILTMGARENHFTSLS